MTLYLIGTVLALSYYIYRLKKSILGCNFGKRVLFAILCSLFWFITVPYLIFKGDLFLTNLELDAKLYNKYVDEVIDTHTKNVKNDLKQKIAKEVKMELGSFDKVLSDMIYFSKPISEIQLAKKIIEEYIKTKYASKYSQIFSPQRFVVDYVENFCSLTDEIANDLISFNVINGQHTFQNTMFKEALGFHTLDTGLSFLGCSVQCEHPIFFIIYFDGNKLRAYVPSYNNWNKHTKMQFGKDVNADYKYISSVLGNVCKENMYRKFPQYFQLQKMIDQIKIQVNYLPKK